MKAGPIIVVSQRSDLPELAGRVIEADDYLSSSGSYHKNSAVINLCRSYRYRSKGYYVSLVADARGQRVLPSIETLEEMREPFGLFRVLREAGIPTLEVAELKARRSRDLPEDQVDVAVLLGHATDARFEKQAQAAYRAWPAPAIRLQMTFREGEWWVSGAHSVRFRDLNEAERGALVELLARTRVPVPGSRSGTEIKRASIAVLHDPDDPFAPSNGDALSYLERFAAEQNVYVDRIGLDEIERLGEYDALFIRTLTGVQEPAFQFALRAEMLDMPVIDDPQSIIRCSNKVFLEELLRREGIPTPRTRIITSRTSWREVSELGQPFVVKLPDGSFSAAVYKIPDQSAYKAVTGELFRRSPLLIAQEYLQTDFDWRITLLDGKVLFAARYFMAAGHWQIRSEIDGAERYGAVEAVRRSEAPSDVVDLARRASMLIGKGLYGVDLKVSPDGPVVIEINDNPNIDRGEEDAADGDAIYSDLVAYFLRQIEQPGGQRPKPKSASNHRRTRRDYRPFSVAGIELEYVTVDRELNAVPLVEPLLRSIAGRPTSDAEIGRIGVSNEIAAHVLELKTLGPVRSLAEAEGFLADGVAEISELLRSELGAQLLPGGMHPWFDPGRAEVWERSNQRIYRAYESIFDLQTHGWMNVQATHLNLPMGRDADAVALYNAAAMVAPYLPAIAASSPIYDGELQPSLDNRLEWILRHQDRVPETQGELIPQRIESLAEYRADVLQPMYDAIGKFPQGEDLQHDFLNARAVVFKAGRRALELRVLDTQECVKMDIAIAVFARSAIRQVYRQLRTGKIDFPPHRLLVDDFRAVIRDGRAAEVAASHILPERRMSTAREVLDRLMELADKGARKDERQYLPLVDGILSDGSLSERIRRRLFTRGGGEPQSADISRIYLELVECLRSNRPWKG